MSDINNNNRIYTKFTRHVDNANEVISADHINKVQSAISNVETNINAISDYTFIDKVLFSFNNNLYVNSMFGDEVNNKKYIDYTLSTNIKNDENLKTVYVSNESPKGEMYSTPITSSIGGELPINDFFLITSEQVPQGASIKYYIINELNEQFPISANTPKTPFHLFETTKKVRIKAVMTKNAMGETPYISGIALLFYDAAVEAQYGFINPDLRRFSELRNGVTTLIRDRAQEDRLVKVIDPTGETSLYYNTSGELDKVITNYMTDSVRTTETLGYGDYANSKGVTERVLLSILSSETNIEGTPEDYEYKFYE